MAKNKWQRSPQHSPNFMNRSNEYDYSSSSSLSRSPSPEVRQRINRFLAAGIPESDLEYLEEFLLKYPDYESFEDDDLRQIKEEFLNRSQRQRRESLPPQLNDSISGSTSIFTILCIILAISAGIWAFIPNANSAIATGEYREKPNIKEILKNVKEDLLVLKKEFRNQEKKIWEEIYSGIIEVISNPTKPSIFVLFADSNDPMSCLATTIGELSRKALGSEKSLILKPAQMDQDTGDVIDSLRWKIPQRKAVIVWDLLSINNEALKAFHNLCDRENPLIKEAIYIITVKATGYNRSQSPLFFIENQLRSNLSGRMDEDSIMPLVTRITDGPIISVKPESNIQCPFKNTII
ncbi:uncharacterized protein LOC117182084 isoform X2 [Belonocnema kinseyi]|nr:uncharacterized protein LOC117182084 isoform X2 [Belonocnema kinseyi]